MTDGKLEWYAVKGLFRWYLKEGGETLKVEERVLLFEARDFDCALELVEEEASIYCEEDKTANFYIESIGWWNAYRIGEEKMQSGTEVYSRLMDTSLDANAFIKRYYPKSHERKS